MQVVKNGGTKENWCALYLSVCENFTSDKALQVMGISSMKRNQEDRKPIVGKQLPNEEIRKQYETGARAAELAKQYHVQVCRIKEAVELAGGIYYGRNRKRN